MEPNDDPKLSSLLREWETGDAPASLDRVLDGRRWNWWRFLATGSIRVPVPIIVALAAALVVLISAQLRPHPQSTSNISLVDFRPVEDMNVRIIR